MRDAKPRIPVWQWLEKNGVDNTEDGGSSADAADKFLASEPPAHPRKSPRSIGWRPANGLPAIQELKPPLYTAAFLRSPDFGEAALELN